MENKINPKRQEKTKEIEPKVEDLIKFRDSICSECVTVLNTKGDIVPSYCMIIWSRRKQKFVVHFFRMDPAAFVRYGTKEVTYSEVISNIIKNQVNQLSTKKEPVLSIILAYRDSYLINSDPKNLKKGDKLYCICELSPLITNNDKIQYRYEGTSQILSLLENKENAGDFTWTEGTEKINIKDFFIDRKENKIARI